MRLRIGIAFTFFFVLSLSYGQDYKNHTKSIKQVDIKIEQGHYSADNSVSADMLIIENPGQVGINQDYTSFTEEEWINTKRQIQENKKRVHTNNEIRVTKIVDTIFLTAPSFHDSSQLSGW
ncbi:hypothetical protein ACWGOQ_0003085 [Aquimarina sp. M1]